MFYKFMKAIVSVLVRLVYRLDVTGVENIPENGAYLLCANHIHAFDPVMVAVFSKRQPRFMAKKELFEKALARAFFRGLGAFPIDRAGTDLQAFRHSMDILKSGHGLLIFSQGTRMEGFDNAKSGVAVFALKSGAPIIPIGIKGSYRFMSKIRIIIGKPISMNKYSGQKVKAELVDEVMGIVVSRITKQCT